MSTRPWVKIWETYHTSRSHTDFAADAMYAGSRLMSLANASDPDDSNSGGRYCVRPDGQPLAHAVLARACRVSPKRFRKILADFIAVGTMSIREDGAVGFPYFDVRQLSPSALRMRNLRSKERHSDAHSDGDVTLDVTLDVTTRGKRTELTALNPLPPQGGGTGSCSSPLGPPPDTPGPEPEPPAEPPDSNVVAFQRPEPPLSAAGPPETPAEREIVDGALKHMRAAVRRVSNENRSLDRPKNRALVLACTRRESATLDDWVRVIDAQADRVRPKRDKWHLLTLRYLVRDKIWSTRLDTTVPEPAPWPPPPDPKPIDAAMSGAELGESASNFDPYELMRSATACLGRGEDPSNAIAELEAMAKGAS
jgi:hypothetical protein